MLPPTIPRFLADPETHPMHLKLKVGAGFLWEEHSLPQHQEFWESGAHHYQAASLLTLIVAAAESQGGTGHSGALHRMLASLLYLTLVAFGRGAAQPLPLPCLPASCP
mmetsp:Transcript_1926/g.4377  ORF Transcript_1926/g.4377 Transcript_1926/m.4377 type:complete len:108 (-) Transcript_1926:446-769(-)